MRKVNIHEAKTNLSKLIEVAESGEDVLIARAGRAVARLTRRRSMEYVGPLRRAAITVP